MKTIRRQLAGGCLVLSLGVALSSMTPAVVCAKTNSQSEAHNETPHAFFTAFDAVNAMMSGAAGAAAAATTSASSYANQIAAGAAAALAASVAGQYAKSATAGYSSWTAAGQPVVLYSNSTAYINNMYTNVTQSVAQAAYNSSEAVGPDETEVMMAALQNALGYGFLQVAKNEVPHAGAPQTVLSSYPKNYFD